MLDDDFDQGDLGAEAVDDKLVELDYIICHKRLDGGEIREFWVDIGHIHAHIVGSPRSDVKLGRCVF